MSVSVRNPGDTPPSMNNIFQGPYEAPKVTNTKVTSAKGVTSALNYPTDLRVHVVGVRDVDVTEVVARLHAASGNRKIRSAVASKHNIA